MWATPTAAISQGSSAGNPNREKAGRDLRQDVRMWPTPTANEDAAGTPNGKMQRQLGNHPDIRGNTPEEWKRGSLNPAWVEWLMGYPVGYTDLNN
jgi:DNA (cytosine-5)-methyltransferase 1